MSVTLGLTEDWNVYMKQHESSRYVKGCNGGVKESTAKSSHVSLLISYSLEQGQKINLNQDGRCTLIFS